MNILRFPLRRIAAVLTARERDTGGWLVLHGSNSWLCGDRDAAQAEAAWLADNLNAQIRELAETPP